MRIIEVATALINRDGKYLIGRRPMEKAFGGLWEFPGGKVKKRETHEQCILREIEREEFPGIKIAVGGFFGESVYRVNNLEIRLFGYKARYISGIFQAKAHIETNWVYPYGILSYPLAPADEALVGKLLAA